LAKEAILSEYSLRLAKPHCEGCHKPKNGVNDDHEYAVESMKHPAELSLAERLQQTIQNAKQEQEEEI